MQHPHYASNNANGSDAVADGRHPQHITNHPTYQLALASPSSSASPSSIDSALYAQSPNGTVPAYAVSSSHRFTSSVASGDLARITPGLRRSSSLRSVANPSRAHKARSPSSATVNTFPTGHNPLPNSQASKSLFSLPTLIRRQKSNGHEKDYSLFSGSEPKRPSTPATMTTAASFRQPLSNMNYVNGGGVNNAVTPPVPTGFVAPPVPVGLNPQATYQTILDTASKRISTLDYLRKAHEGRVYWFNTLLFTKPELLKLPYFAPPKLARRATNYLLLGFSLPTILDLNSQTATEYLKALNALLSEFEQYQSMHPPDGSSSASSLSRGRIPQMFKRATGGGASGGGKGRRASSAQDTLAALGVSGSSGSDALSLLSSGSSTLSGSTAVSSASSATLVASERPETLGPTESYAHLLTPSLPFDPDFFETFATLCDVLIDCYTKVTQLVGGPEHCVPGVAELFQKADAKVRKIVVQGVVREFEGACRDGVKGEVKGIGRVVLGGLM